MTKPRLIAFYLPQYHRIPENDEWWGEGFTDWVNVKKCKPRFKGHYQPHVPSDLGYYDLMDPEVREKQAEMAKAYGIFGFCYYHYWFSGKRLLEKPFQEVLNSDKPDFPFCLCWANENWSRRWDGKEHEVLMRQEYSLEDDQNHINYLISAFRDPRYIKINDRPLLLVYRVNDLPNSKKTAEIWRKTAKKNDFPDIYLCSTTSLPINHRDPSSVGFDAAIDFVPDSKYLPQFEKPLWYRFHFPFLWRIMNRLTESPFGNNQITSYESLVQSMLNRPEPDYKTFPGVTPGWDSSSRRRKAARTFYGSTPELFGYWLGKAIKKAQERFSNPEEQLVFINAWNEWAEGNHLEPDQKWGRQYLVETQKALENVPSSDQ